MLTSSGMFVRRHAVATTRGQCGTSHLDQRADEQVPVVGGDHLAALPRRQWREPSDQGLESFDLGSGGHLDSL